MIVLGLVVLGLQTCPAGFPHYGFEAMQHSQNLVHVVPLLQSRPGNLFSVIMGLNSFV